MTEADQWLPRDGIGGGDRKRWVERITKRLKETLEDEGRVHFIVD